MTRRENGGEDVYLLRHVRIWFLILTHPGSLPSTFGDSIRSYPSPWPSSCLKAHRRHSTPASNIGITLLMAVLQTKANHLVLPQDLHLRTLRSRSAVGNPRHLDFPSVRLRQFLLAHSHSVLRNLLHQTPARSAAPLYRQLRQEPHLAWCAGQLNHPSLRNL